MCETRVLVILLFVIPFAILIGSIIQNSGPLIEWAKSPTEIRLPELLWLKNRPFIGNKLFYGWHTLVANGGNTLIAKLQPYVGEATSWFLAQAINAGRFVFHLVVMLLFSALLYLQGESVILSIRHFAIRLAGTRGDTAILLAGQSIRAVALGVVVTALIQAITSGIGLALADIPYAAILTILIFVCCVAQLGPLLIMVPSIVWLFWSGNTSWAIIMIVWSIIVATMDGVLRPILIRMGANLSMILILIGVIGGILSFSVIGLFIGPVVLAVSHNLLTAWMNEVSKPAKLSNNLTKSNLYKKDP
ncbi:AI-2E family transporter YdiK [Arsenophonus sp. PmNCSU2021_1]|uniref:AI-2E family transporter YdiK n=1 Tax=Arsenophonus sp. PmNCSU2021_1 TaxID=3118989 RepID=UPI002FF2D687